MGHTPYIYRQIVPLVGHVCTTYRIPKGEGQSTLDFVLLIILLKLFFWKGNIWMGKAKFS